MNIHTLPLVEWNKRTGDKGFAAPRDLEETIATLLAIIEAEGYSAYLNDTVKEAYEIIGLEPGSFS